MVKISVHFAAGLGCCRIRCRRDGYVVAAVETDMSSLQKIGTIAIRPPAPPSSKILVVVESPVGSAAMVGMLNELGYKNVETAPSGAQGLVKLLTEMFDLGVGNSPHVW